MLKHLRARLDTPEQYRDEATGCAYSRIVGGLAWPNGDKPGWLAVVARDLDPDHAGNYHYWLLSEYQSNDLGELVRHALDLRQEYQAQTWVGNVGNRPALAIMGELMAGFAYRERLSLDMAPHAGNAQGLSFYLALIRECVRPGKKLLHLGAASAMPSQLSQVLASDVSSAPDSHPAIAALGYALAELYGWAPAETQQHTINYRDRAGAWML
jgi:hypothetical protein